MSRIALKGSLKNYKDSYFGYFKKNFYFEYKLFMNQILLYVYNFIFSVLVFLNIWNDQSLNDELLDAA